MIFEKQIVNLYREMAYTRCDDNGMAYYFSAEDFPGLQKESYPFRSLKGYRLQGYLYHYDHPQEGRLVAGGAGAEAGCLPAVGLQMGGRAVHSRYLEDFADEPPVRRHDGFPAEG